MDPASRRRNEALLRYWEGLLEGRPFPSEDDLDPDHGDLAELWDDCFLLQARDVEHKKDYNYSYLGKNIIAAYQGGIPAFMEGLVAPDASHLARQFEHVFLYRQPLISAGEHRIPDKGILRYRQVLLPLGHSADRVESILGCMNYRIYPYTPD